MHSHPTLKVTVNPHGCIEVRTLWPIIQSIVVGGCGARGPGYIGFLRILEKYKGLKDTDRVLGVSAGAIAALMLALGYTADEAELIFSDKPMMDFLEKANEYSKIRAAAKVAFANNHALSSGVAFRNFIELLIEYKLGDRHATFAELERKIALQNKYNLEKKLRHLYVVASNMSYEDPVIEVFYSENGKGTPNVEMARAVYASAALPYLFEMLPIYKADHAYYISKLNPSLKNNDEEFFYSAADIYDKGLLPGVESILEPDILRKKTTTQKSQPP